MPLIFYLFSSEITSQAFIQYCIDVPFARAKFSSFALVFMLSRVVMPAG